VLDDPDVVLVSYDTLVRDIRLFARIEWNVVALDEAQSVKNPETARRQAVARLDSRLCVCVSGTPVENSLVDLWSLSDLAEPGLLGPLDRFQARFDDTEVSAETLEPIVRPLMLRRRVRDVAQDLPPLIEIPNILEMHPAEAAAYERERSRTNDAGKPIAALAKLQFLRMFSAHPWLRQGRAGSGPERASAKYERLLELLEQIFAVDERVLVFGAFNELLDIMRSDLPARFDVPVDGIDGRVPVDMRQVIIDRFQSQKGPAALLLGPRSAGVGLNITNASHVIHHTLEWNPAIEDQATARAWRRGQELPVTLHRLIYANTVDEVMNDRIQRKRGIAEVAVDGRSAETIDEDDLARAIGMSPTASLERFSDADRIDPADAEIPDPRSTP
jgi:SNF2 family DNA or RNA helicase